MAQPPLLKVLRDLLNLLILGARDPAQPAQGALFLLRLGGMALGRYADLEFGTGAFFALWLKNGVSVAGLCCLINGLSMRAAGFGERQWEEVFSISREENAHFLGTSPTSRWLDTMKTYFSTRSDVSWAALSHLVAPRVTNIPIHLVLSLF